jgi:hypothetical protein
MCVCVCLCDGQAPEDVRAIGFWARAVEELVSGARVSWVCRVCASEAHVAQVVV